MEQIKHECGVAMIRLLKPLEYYKDKYGSYAYGLNLLYLLMEKQHNRGQEGAGIGVVKLNSKPGHEYVFRERAMGSNAITEVFANVMPQLKVEDVESWQPDRVELFAPFVGEIYMGHLRYSTTGKSGISYVHPFLRRNNWKSRNLLLCGNFNLTNVDEIFSSIVSQGQHPRIYSDTVVILEQLGYALDKECHRLYRENRDKLDESLIEKQIEQEINIANVLRPTAPKWDGGFVICGATGSGDIFALRDSHGIRPAFYYRDDEIFVLTSERPVIQTVLNVSYDDITELRPGNAIIVSRDGSLSEQKILDDADNRKCSFERIYFSRGSDADIYAERKELGRRLVPNILKAVNNNLNDTVFSFVPNTAEVAFMGMIEGLERHLDRDKAAEILRLQKSGKLAHDAIIEVMKRKLRVEKLVIKDIKLRTFITEGNCRDDMAAHVYDVTYGCVREGRDNVVVIDDSIVRGTTLRQSIIKMLDRLNPLKIVIVSSAPQVRYPDCYGIDMSSMGEFIAFKAAIALLKERGMHEVIDQVYADCIAQKSLPASQQTNCVKAIYEPFSEEEISRKIADMLKPQNTGAEIEIVYQPLKSMQETLKHTQGDWYFSGDYPTPGGVRLVNRAYINYYEGRADR